MHIFLLFCIIGVNFPPLTESEASRLAFAVDGRDSLDDGFAVLVENSHRWLPGLADETREVENSVFSELLEDPVKHRGKELTIVGVIEQQSASPPPWDDVAEWFVRDPSGVPFVLYVVGETDIPAKVSIVAHAQFYKRVDLTGRDGQVRSFVTFVTTSKAITRGTSGNIFPQSLLLVPIVVIGVMVVYFLSRKKATRKLRIRNVTLHIDEVIDAADDASMYLPDDPADALALLHESAEELT